MTSMRCSHDGKKFSRPSSRQADAIHMHVSVVYCRVLALRPTTLLSELLVHMPQFPCMTLVFLVATIRFRRTVKQNWQF